MNCFLFTGQPKIIHRDIKAANILVDFNFEAKVTVFCMWIVVHIHHFICLIFESLTDFLRSLLPGG